MFLHVSFLRLSYGQRRFGFLGVFQTRNLLSHDAAKEGWSAADFRWPLREGGGLFLFGVRGLVKGLPLEMWQTTGRGSFPVADKLINHCQTAQRRCQTLVPCAVYSFLAVSVLGGHVFYWYEDSIESGMCPIENCVERGHAWTIE